MTIDEAIAHAREVAEENYRQGFLCHANPNDEELDGCIECAREHEQLTEWLEELKALRYEANEWRKSGYSHGYNKAIDDFAERLCYKIKSEIDDCADELQWVDEIAEQLKEGD